MADEDFDIYGDVAVGDTDEKQGGSPAPVYTNYGEPSRDEEDNYDEEESEDQEETAEDTVQAQPSIYIGNLTWWTTDQELEDLFSPFGKLRSIKFFEDKVNGKSKGYALVEFATAEAAARAKEHVHGK